MTWQIVRAGEDFHLINLQNKPKRIVVTFQRSSIRPVLETYASINNFSSQWIGCILRKFLKEFPNPFKFVPRVPEVSDYAPLTLVEYMQSKGYKVYKPLPFPDAVISEYLLKKWGYVVETSERVIEGVPCLN